MILSHGYLCRSVTNSFYGRIEIAFANFYSPRRENRSGMEIIMKERIVNYLAYIDELLASDDSSIDYDNLIKEHLIQIRFFMHERFIHLIVTVIFALLTFGSIFAFLYFGGVGLLALTVLFLVLLFPYICHYYRLENGVQKMYKQYDEMLKRSHN